MIKILFAFFLMSMGVASCNNNYKQDNNMEEQKETVVLMKTDKGDIKIKLYNETPKHRDNFLKLVDDGVYEGLLFHRVIKDFMVQGGDPESKNAPKGKMLGAGDVGYTIPAEFVYPKYYHKKGALAAARQGDQVNPQKESSGCQFYIVTGKKYSEQELKSMEKQMNEAKVTNIFNSIARKNMALIRELQQKQDQNALYDLQEKIYAEAVEEAKKTPDFKFTSEQIADYTTLGGTPFLDNQYTVFGEVVDGLDVIDSIQVVKTDRSDRPVDDVKILEVEVCD